MTATIFFGVFFFLYLAPLVRECLILHIHGRQGEAGVENGWMDEGEGSMATILRTVCVDVHV